MVDLSDELMATKKEVVELREKAAELGEKIVAKDKLIKDLIEVSKGIQDFISELMHGKIHIDELIAQAEAHLEAK